MSAFVINNTTGVGMDQIIELAQKLNFDVMSLSPEDTEDIEDRQLLRRMHKSLASGIGDRKEMFELLGRQ